MPSWEKLLRKSLKSFVKQTRISSRWNDHRASKELAFSYFIFWMTMKSVSKSYSSNLEKENLLEYRNVYQRKLKSFFFNSRRTYFFQFLIFWTMSSTEVRLKNNAKISNKNYTKDQIFSPIRILMKKFKNEVANNKVLKKRKSCEYF